MSIRSPAQSAPPDGRRLSRRWFAACAVALTALFAGTLPGHAQDDAARRILKAMSDFVSSQRVISVSYSSDIEVLTSELQKLQFTSSGELLLSRPDRLRATRVGGYADVELVFDGSTVAVHDRGNGAYAQGPIAGSVDQVIGTLRERYNMDAPGADLLLTNAYETLISNVVEAKHIGRGVIDGVECEHLAFRTEDADWQIWVEVGERPIPRKYIITSKTLAGAPQYTLRIREWRMDAQVAANAFAFSPPAGATKREFADLTDIDEVPAGTIRGTGQ
jgi:hypothetical protein